MTQVIGHYMGNYPAVTIQDFALAKELFNRFQNTAVTLATIMHSVDIVKDKDLTSPGRNAAAVERQSSQDT